MSRSAFLRARRPEHKQQRREAILAAACELARTSGVRNVTLGAVADAVGLAKSNIVRYFGTREEIFLVLAAEEWRSWAAAAGARVATAGDTTDVMRALAETLVDRPLFCDLLANSATSLEHNVSVDAARVFKHATLAAAAELGGQVARATGLTEREGLELTVVAAGLAGMLYPAAHPSPALAQLYAEDPELAAARPELLPSLVRALSAFAAGLPTVRD
ncbi:TetR/AcrR family transcriptional regulator [Nonomuraea aridisoli]|uniref:TetR/AcrR family transcriptional regulator n=1 Tax=Nonomuraea aridisoli TaxID=2070368 RepID=A0A2W2DP48_9ACTN|nr:TetR family transcriptional regulator [Nonomuraea aridisoli]PZG13682.1 TetR/AcrR family transcriptional regulator [Nonomuraea aridisoli]